MFSKHLKESNSVKIKASQLKKDITEFGAKGAKVLGHLGIGISLIDTGIDAIQGNPNLSNFADLDVSIVSGVVIGVEGAVALPYVIDEGIIYGVANLAGLDEWIGSKYDIRDKINVVKQKN